MSPKHLPAALAAVGLMALSHPALAQTSAYQGTLRPGESPAPPGRKSRFAILTDQQMTSEQKAIVDNVMKIGRSGMDGPGNMLVRSPKVNAAQMQLGAYLHSPEAGLKSSWQELTILIVSRAYDANYEWWVHSPRAIKAGIPQQAVEDIKARRAPRGLAPEDQVVFDFLNPLIRDHKVSDAAYDKAKALLGEKGIVDLIAFAGSYTNTAMLLNATDTKLPVTPATRLESLY